MRKVLEEHLSQQAMASREAITYSIEAVREKEDVFNKYINTKDLWNHAIISMNKGKITRQELLNTATIIRNTTGWNDPVDTMSVHAYLAKSQHEALMEVKRRRNEIEENPEEPTNKRRSQRHAETAQNKELPIPHINRPSKAGPSILHPGNASLPKEKWEERIEVDRVKGKSIAKREFHEVIIDTIKRKRQLTGESAVSNALDTILTEEEEHELAECCINKKGQFDLDEYKDDDKDPGHYIKGHWARATTETLVKMEDLEEPIIALIDHGFEINIMSKEVYKRGRWPIDINHRWVIRAANNTRGDLYGACPNVKVKVGDVTTEQNFFVQDTTSYPMILGQPNITVVRMETKVLDDGSACARISSQDGKKAVQFLTVPANDEHNRNYLRSELLPRVSEEFTDFCRVPL
uniref:Predicted protein n=1 Tax=Physcomitrium patens TaxID=3218 RepID=A9U5X3_PHYPA